MSSLNEKISKYFFFEKYNTNWRTEILAGISTYLSLAYIFILNPAIMSGLNKTTANANNPMDISAILFATIIASGVTTLIMGIWARLPFALAPGLEMNGFFAVVVCGTIGLTWQQALGAVFWSGVLCIFFTIIPARQRIIDSIPTGLKSAMAASVGVFVLTIGLFLAGLVKFDSKTNTISGIGDFFSPPAIALYIGLLISAVLGLKKLKFTAGMLVAIIIATVYCKTQNIVVAEPAKISTDMFKAIGQADIFSIFFDIRLLPVFITFFLIDFYGSIGKFIGLTSRSL